MKNHKIKNPREKKNFKRKEIFFLNVNGTTKNGEILLCSYPIQITRSKKIKKK
jgi:hypothetical protein